VSDRLLVVRVPSLTETGRTYAVTIQERRGVRSLDCDCVAGGYGRRCSHQEIADAADRRVERCRAAHGTEGGLVCRDCVTALLAAMRRKVEREYVEKASVKKRDEEKRRRAAERKAAAKARKKSERAAAKEAARS
jgi:hypothetical protein